MPNTSLSSKDYCPFTRKISDEELACFAHWTFEQRIRWVEVWARIYRNSTTREERISHYRLKEGENVRYYDAHGWPEHF